MSPHSRRIYYLAFVVFASFIFISITSCNKLFYSYMPGYAVHIYIKDHNYDIIDKLFDYFIQYYEFKKFNMQSDDEVTKCRTYIKYLIPEKPRNDTQYILLQICYNYYNSACAEASDQVNQTWISVANDSNGQDTFVKTEIDKIATHIYIELSKRFPGMVELKAKRTGLPII